MAVNKDMSENEEEIVEEEVKELSVTTATGSVFPVQTEEEVQYYQSIKERYLTDNHFPNISDLTDLDRILALELICHRWLLFLSREQDYNGGKIDPDSIQKNVKSYSTEIRDIKKSLGIDKFNRDKGRGDSIAEQWENLKLRAKEFGIHRDEMNQRSLEILMGLRALITFYENSTPPERAEFNWRLDDIVDWIKEQFKEIEELDKHFRENQKIWIREINS